MPPPETLPLGTGDPVAYLDLDPLLKRGRVRTCCELAELSAEDLRELCGLLIACGFGPGAVAQ